MPQDTTNLIDVLLLIFGVVIAGFAIGGAVQAWRIWSDHRRIERHLGRRCVLQPGFETSGWAYSSSQL